MIFLEGKTQYFSFLYHLEISLKAIYDQILVHLFNFVFIIFIFTPLLGYAMPKHSQFPKWEENKRSSSLLICLYMLRGFLFLKCPSFLPTLTSACKTALPPWRLSSTTPSLTSTTTLSRLDPSSHPSSHHYCNQCIWLLEPWAQCII